MPFTKLTRTDLAIDRERLKLKPRPYPYWSLITWGRHLGYLKRGGEPTYWVARYRAKNGWYHQSRLGLVSREERGEPGLTYDEARTAAWEWFRSPSVCKDIGDMWPVGRCTEVNLCPIGDVYTIGHAAHDFVEWKKLTSAPSYVATLVTLVNCHIVPRLAFLPAENFHAEYLARFVRDVLETPARSGVKRTKPTQPIGRLSPDQLRKRKMTVNTLIGVLRGMLLYAWESGKIQNSRAWMVLRRIPNANVPRMLHLSRNECRSLISQASPELRRLILGALYTGCRVSELLRMEACHVGRDGYGIYIAPVKTYKARFVFLPDEAMQFLLELAKGKRSNELLFVRDNGRPWFGNYKHQFKLAIHAAGLPKEFAFHGLRHTYASQLVQAGTPLLVVSEQLGHVDPVHVMRTYGHLAPQMRESEIRQRFETIDQSTYLRSQKKGSVLREWRAEALGPDWQTYATINQPRAKGSRKSHSRRSAADNSQNQLGLST